MTKLEKSRLEKLRKRRAAQIKQYGEDLWCALISEELAGALFNEIKEGIILEPPKGAAHQKIYSQSRVVSSTARGRYFTTARPCPIELLPYVVLDVKGETPIPADRLARQKEVEHYYLVLKCCREAEEQLKRSSPSFLPPMPLVQESALPPFIAPKFVPEMSPSETDGSLATVDSAPALANVDGNNISKSATPSNPLGTQYREGAVRQVSRNEYERDHGARQRCIEHYGSRCFVCGFDFKEVYGELGSGFIHVHHLRPLSEIRKKYVVDPVSDLRPVCPNCHAMIHNGPEMLTIESLQALIVQKARAMSKHT
jgi:hypothetical protein